MEHCFQKHGQHIMFEFPVRYRITLSQCVCTASAILMRTLKHVCAWIDWFIHKFGTSVHHQHCVTDDSWVKYYCYNCTSDDSWVAACAVHTFMKMCAALHRLLTNIIFQQALILSVIACNLEGWNGSTRFVCRTLCSGARIRAVLVPHAWLCKCIVMHNLWSQDSYLFE